MGKTQPIKSIDDVRMWESIEREQLELMACCNCHKFRYPPAPICAECLCMETEWKPVSGKGKVVSWVVFHRKYFDDFPPPYNAMTVRLEEGPLIVTNLTGPQPEGSWIGREVKLEYVVHDGRKQHAARIVD